MPEENIPKKEQYVSILTDVFARSTTSVKFKQKQIKPSVIIAMLELCDSNLNVEQIRNTLAARLLEHTRFRRRFELTKQNKHILIPEDPDIERHIVEIDGKGSFDVMDLNALITAVSDEEWDINRPLWRVRIITHLKKGGSMLFFTIDHAIGDGTSMLEVLRTLYDNPPAPVGFDRRGPPSVKWSHQVISFAMGCYEGCIGWAIKNPDVDNGLRIPQNTQLSQFSSKLFLPVKSVSLNSIKKLKSKLPGVTMNDIVIGVVTIALRKYLENQNNQRNIRRFKVHGCSTVDLRGRCNDFDGQKLENGFVLVSYKLPLDYVDEIDAIWKVKATLDEFKLSPILYLIDKIGRTALEWMPEPLLIKSVFDIARKPSCIISNIKGPHVECKIAGYAVKDINFLVTSPVGLYVGIISYKDKINISVTIDAAANINIGFMKECFEHAYEALESKILMKSKVSNPLPVPDMTPMSAKIFEFTFWICAVGAIIFFSR